MIAWDDSFPGFLNTPLVLPMFSLCIFFIYVNNFFVRTSLRLYHSFFQGWFVSSIVKWGIRTILSLFIYLFFFKKKISRAQKHLQAKIS